MEPHPFVRDCCCCSVAQSCLTLCDPTDCSMPGSSVLQYLPGICSNSCPLSRWCYLSISYTKNYHLKSLFFFSFYFHDAPIGKHVIFVLIFSLTGFLAQEECESFVKTEWQEEVDYVTYQFLFIYFLKFLFYIGI